MFKAGKSTHLTILATFALVFIVVYLYYTITDLRKLQIEVSKLSKTVQTLAQSPSCCPMPGGACPIGAGVGGPIPTMTFDPMPAPEDDDSVATEEIKNILDRQESDDDEETAAAAAPAAPPALEEPAANEEPVTQAPAEPTVEDPVSETKPITTTKTVNVKATTKKSKATATK
jgi:hypothetical protein